MEYLSIKSYALRHNLSMFNVIKMIRSQKLKTVTKKEGKKDIIYIAAEKKTAQGSTVSKKHCEKRDIYDDIRYLKNEINQIKKEFEKLKFTMHNR